MHLHLHTSASTFTCSSCSGLHCASPITLLTAYRLIPGGGCGRLCPATAPPEAPPCGEEGVGRLACSFNTNLFKEKKKEQLKAARVSFFY